jgi:hypothetical protein
MNALKLTVAAATLAVGFIASASAMPVSKLGTVDVATQADEVRTVCNRWGRCWWVPGGYGYRYGYGYRRGWHHRHW